MSLTQLLRLRVAFRTLPLFQLRAKILHAFEPQQWKSTLRWKNVRPIRTRKQMAQLRVEIEMDLLLISLKVLLRTKLYLRGKKAKAAILCTTVLTAKEAITSEKANDEKGNQGVKAPTPVRIKISSKILSVLFAIFVIKSCYYSSEILYLIHNN